MTTVTDSHNTLIQGTVNSVHKAAENISAIKETPDRLNDVFKVSYYGILGIQYLKNSTKPGAVALKQLAGGMSIIDLTDIFYSANYWAHGRFIDDFKKGHVFSFFGEIGFAIASVGGTVLWVAELGFKRLSTVSASIGLGPIVMGGVVVGYLGLSIQSIYDICEAKNSKQVTKAVLDLVGRVLNVALYTLFLVPGAQVPAIVVLGITAKGMGVVSFIYKHNNKSAFIAA